MPGLELVKNLADLDRELTEKVAEARRAADQQVKDAEAEAQRLLAEAEAQIRQWEEESRKQSAEENAWLVEATRNRAQEEKERLRSQALPNLERAVKFILTKVLP
jgi:vacuolar-type H+-ATPase subunit H